MANLCFLRENGSHQVLLILLSLLLFGAWVTGCAELSACYVSAGVCNPVLMIVQQVCVHVSVCTCVCVCVEDM